MKEIEYPAIFRVDDAHTFIKEQYDAIAGHLPEQPTDLTLVLDTYNRIDLGYLMNMGFDVSGENIKFEDILNVKGYHLLKFRRIALKFLTFTRHNKNLLTYSLR